MRIWEGKDFQGLLERLNELDSLTTMDSIICPKQKVKVTATAYGSGLARWSMDVDGAAYETGNVASGSKYDRFCDTLRKLSEGVEMDVYSVCVLAYADTLPHKTYDGRFQTRWYSIDPLDQYDWDEKAGQPKFRFENLNVTEEEYKMLMSTKLAVKSNDIVYSMTRDSLASAGRLLLDSSSVFKLSEDSPLSCALMFAEALSDRDCLKILTRSSEGVVRRVSAVVGDRYRYIPQKEFFMEVLRNAAGFGVYRVGKWSVTDEQTTVELLFPEERGCRKGFYVSASDTSGAPMKISAFGMFSNGSVVVLKQSSMCHNKSSADKGVKSMFEGMADAFLAFDEFVEDMDKEVFFDPERYKKQLKPIRSLIGSRRYSVPDIAEYNGLELAMILSGSMDADIKYRGDLLMHIWNLLLDIQSDSCEELRSRA